jgi:hypothetical protein
LPEDFGVNIARLEELLQLSLHQENLDTTEKEL